MIRTTSTQTRKFYVFAIVLFILTLSLNYFFLLSKKTHLVDSGLAKVNASLVSNFNKTEKILIFVGRKIVEDSPNLDPEIIHKIFIHNLNYGAEGIFSWSLFDWVNGDGYQIVNTVIGVRRDRLFIAEDRNYRSRANDNWRIIFSRVAVGNPSGVITIPAGVQVDTRKNKNAGTVVLGIDVKKLSALVQSELDDNIHFLIVDRRDDKPAFGSMNYEKFFTSKDCKALAAFDSDSFTSIKEMGAKYPYRILVRYDKKEFWREVWINSINQIFQILAIAALVVFPYKKRR